MLESIELARRANTPISDGTVGGELVCNLQQFES